MPVFVNAWGALNATAPLLAAIDLLDEQLVPGGSQPTTQVETAETVQVQATPYGELFDVLQSDVHSDCLRFIL